MTAYDPPPPPQPPRPPEPDPAAAAPAGACPQCGAPVRPDQDWCLNCGAAITTQVAGARGWQTPIAIVAVVLAIAAGALVVAFLEITDDADRLAAAPVASPTPVPTETPPAIPSPSPVASPSPTPSPIPTASPTTSPGAAIPGVSPTPGAGTPAITPSPGRSPTPFPTPGTTATPGGSGGTGTISSWPSGRTAYTVILLSGESKSAADKKAREYQQQGIDVGVLNSSEYSSLRPGYWVVFSGQYDTEDQAESALNGLKSRVPEAYVRRVRPK